MAILRFLGFGCKISILANFGEFWGILTPEIVKNFLTPKGTYFPRDTRFEILRVEIGSAVSSVALFKL